MRFEEYRRHDGLGLAALVAGGEVGPEELLRCAVERLAAVDAALGCSTIDETDAALERLERGLPDGPFQGRALPVQGPVRLRGRQDLHQR